MSHIKAYKEYLQHISCFESMESWCQKLVNPNIIFKYLCKRAHEPKYGNDLLIYMLNEIDTNLCSH